MKYSFSRNLLIQEAPKMWRRHYTVGDLEVLKFDEKEKLAILLEDLSSLESYVRDLLSFLPLPIYVVSSNGIILEANPALSEISGYEIEELIGSLVEEIFEKEEIEKLLRETLEKGFLRAREVSFFTKEKKRFQLAFR